MSNFLATSHQRVNILVAEDDNFQRLALIDILELCEYSVTAVENGKLAKDELMKEDSNYDLVLLDLMMPEMDGLELLTFMKENEKLKDIPVIIMSSDGETDSVAACLDTGAKDYLIKPIRIQNVKGLANHVSPSQKKKETKNFSQYQPIKLLGQGAAGSVQLVRNNSDNELYALKTIQLKLMSPHERKLAENEVTLLKVLNGPTIIKYYEHYTDSDTIYIVMEYASGGSLFDRISDHKLQGKPIPNEKILDWTAQLVIGIMLMHSKNILHRDIKSQNMFLTNGDIVKLGDFGISKSLGTQSDFAKTYCGTPYFMSPEVCRGENYNQKSDIWALGCALYELAALKKPFDDNNIPGLIKMICEKDYDPLPDNIDLKIRGLIYSMLYKDPVKRPTIWEVAQVEIVKERIMKFVTENNCKESVEGIIDFKKALMQNAAAGNTAEKKQDKFPFPIDKADELATLIREGITLRTIKSGMFSTEENVVNGEDIFKWFKVHLNCEDLSQITQLCNKMLDEGYIYSPSGETQYQNKPNHYYRFQMDRPGIAANAFKIFKGQSRNALQISVELITKMNEVIKGVRSETNGEIVVDVTNLDSQKAYAEYLKSTIELQHVQLNGLERDEKIAFFINLYQVTHVHRIIKEKKHPTPKPGFFGKIKGIFRTPKDPFYYNVGGQEYSVEDIKHGILRGNKKAPEAYIFKTMKDSDQRRQIVNINDNRIILLLMEEGVIPKKLEAYNGRDLHEKLDKYCQSMLSSSVVYDPNENELILPAIFKTYIKDFGTNADLVNFILNNNRFTANPQEVLAQVREGKFAINFDDES